MEKIARWVLAAVAVTILGCGGGATGSRRGVVADAGPDGGSTDAAGVADVDLSQYPPGAVYDAEHNVLWLANGDREDCEPAWSDKPPTPTPPAPPLVWNDKCHPYICCTLTGPNSGTCNPGTGCLTHADCPDGLTCNDIRYFEM